MIEQLLKLQGRVRDRSVAVGRAVQTWKHHAYTEYINKQSKGIPVAAPFLLRMTEEFVYLAVAIDEQGRHVAIEMPTPLFEEGDLGDIRTWVTKENIAFAKQQQEAADLKAAEHRRDEIAVLRELQEKYND